jgi:AraC family carnitine catabolism transcriptional activator
LKVAAINYTSLARVRELVRGSFSDERAESGSTVLFHPAAGIPLNALILASDALGLADQNSGRRFFSWSFVCGTGEAVRASNGMWFGADCSDQDMPLRSAYFIFAGNPTTQRNSPKLLAQLRPAARYGAIIGSVDTGAIALAPYIVLHWEAEPTLRERIL